MNPDGTSSDGKSERKFAVIHYVPDAPALVDICVGKTFDLVRGDIIINTSDINYGYRTCGMYFFDGKTIIKPCTEYDDYGTVPMEFKLLTEFPPGYWDLPVGGLESINVHQEFHYVRKNGNLFALTGPPKKMDACAYWHHPDNCGISPVILDVSRVVTVGDKVVVRYKNCAIISDKTVEETQKDLKSQRVWWVFTRININSRKYNNTAMEIVAEIAKELDVDPNDILTVMS
jgi:hypothetical protein